MGLNVGSTPVTAVYVGSTPVTAVYVGTEKIWPTIRSVTIPFEYGEYYGGYIEGDTSLIADITGADVTFVVDVIADRPVWRSGMGDGTFVPAGVRARSTEYFGVETITFTEA